MRAVLLLTMLSLTSFAQTKKPEPKEIIFGDGDLIDGDLSKPDVEYIKGVEAIAHTSLIRVRERVEAAHLRAPAQRDHQLEEGLLHQVFVLEGARGATANGAADGRAEAVIEHHRAARVA